MRDVCIVNIDAFPTQYSSSVQPGLTLFVELSPQVSGPSLALQLFNQFIENLARHFRRTAVQTALDHLLDMLRLNRSDTTPGQRASVL